MTKNRKEQLKKYNETYFRTEVGKIKRLFNSMRQRSIRREMDLPDFTKEELSTWLYKNNFKELFENWKASSFNTKLSPSVDRLDDYKPYTFSNMRLVTWCVNKKKSYKDMKNGVNNKQSRSVNQINKITGEIINNFHSQREASRQTGISQGNINSCCKGKSKSAGGFKWEYI